MKPNSTAARIFNVVDLEADIAEVLKEQPPPLPRILDYAPPDVRLPAYLEHRDGVDDVGKLSAEAVAKSYELAAQEIEKMGEELKERTRLCEKLVSDSNQALDMVREVAAEFRDAGKAIFLRIEDASAMTSEVRQTCDAMRAKIAGPSS